MGGYLPPFPLICFPLVFRKHLSPIPLIFCVTRVSAAYGWDRMGSSGGDQSGRKNSSHSIIEELARSDWMGLSGGDQSGRKNYSHSVIQEFARSDWMGLSGGDQESRRNSTF